MSVPEVHSHAGPTVVTIEHCERPSVLDRVGAVALRALHVLATIAEIAVGVALYHVSPALFCAGLLTGVLFTRPVSAMHDRLAKTWDCASWAEKAFIILGAASALPITITFAAFHYGSYAGVSLAPEGC